MHGRAAMLDMTADDEATVRHRLYEEIPALIVAAEPDVIVMLGPRPGLRRSTAEAIALAHRELRAARGRLVVVTDQATAARCCRALPALIVAATVRQAERALGLGSVSA
jgi:hypothetical protein